MEKRSFVFFWAACANVSKDTMPTEARGEIGQIRPSGWHTVKYTGVVDGNYLYNRCHLIAYCLTAENANKKNLILHRISFHQDTGSDQVTALKNRCHAV